MKYPQLVSARAVSAISDWLVTQLEQLGVDASPVYSRLLLSLLHTPLQINALDLAEISDNKVGNLGGRNKLYSNQGSNSGNYRRFSAADTESLKRLAAIDSLLEAVSSDQQLSKIESLVDELSLKLREIEQQNSLEESEYADNNDSSPQVNSQPDPIKKTSATPEDPAKRYYRAFPALSDQSSNDFSNRQATKSLPWPRTDPSTIEQKLPPKETIESNDISGSNSLGIKKKQKRRRVSAGNMSSTSTNQLNVPATAKSSTSGKHGGNLATNHRIGATKIQSHGRKKATAIWDTDFDGAWEMGRDLIHEFVMKQNNRNRSISESDAGKFVQLNDDRGAQKKQNSSDANVLVNAPIQEITRDFIDDKKYDDATVVNAEENLMRIAAAATSTLFGKNFDMTVNMGAYNSNQFKSDSGTFSSASTVTDSSLLMANNEKAVIHSEGYATPDTMASWNELDGNYVTAPRRLYEREVSNESINCAGIVSGDGEFGATSDCVDSGCDETNHLAAFEAKFDRSVEALWNDSKNDEQTTFAGNVAGQPVQSFWFNYYRHHYNHPENQANLETQPSQMAHSMASMPANNFGSSNNQNLYTAMQPNSLNSNYLSSNNTSMTNVGGMGLTSSIWTDNANNNEDDVSFYANARLWEKAKLMEQQSNFNSMPIDSESGSGSNVTAIMNVNVNYDIGLYENSNFSKWSDCSFETPFVPMHRDVSATNANPLKTKNDEKIRRNLFGNSYSYDAKSLQMMSNFKSGSTLTHNEPNSTEYRFSQTQSSNKRLVTLTNHSQGSSFKEVEPMSYELRQELLQITKARSHHAPPVDAITEDLLTSERSRFRPIKQTYADGYTFDISDELDEIDYERSASGTLYHESEVYREYYVYDEEGNGGSRCGVDKSMCATNDSEFVLKYCVRQNDKCCQTEDMPPSDSASPPNVSTLLAKANKMLQFNSFNSDDNASMENQMVYFRNTAMNQSQFISVQQLRESSINTDSMDQMDQIADISQDSYINLDGWSLAENRKRCNNNNNAHSLWEHCAACSTDVVSMPANRLLKDELSIEADEIMSDLKYMQNLYIGSDWEDDNDSDTMVDCECVDEDDGLLQSLEPKTPNKKSMLLDDAVNDDAAGDGYNDDLSTSSQIYYNVSKLISNLMLPEEAQSLVQAISEKCQIGRLTADETSQNEASVNENDNVQNTKDVPASSLNVSSTNSNTKYFGSIWANSDNSIWRKDPPSETESIWTYTVQSDGGKSKNLGMKASSKLGDQWEHAHLEKLWRNMPEEPDECATSSEDADLKTDEQKRLTTMDSTIYTTNTDECEQPSQTATTANDDLANSQNALQKFIELIKQANKKDATNEPTIPETPIPTPKTPEQALKQETAQDEEQQKEQKEEPEKEPEQASSHQHHHHHHHHNEEMHRFHQCLLQRNLEIEQKADSTQHCNLTMTDDLRLINNRTDRKRRHSATSQNFFDQFNCALTTCDAIDGIKKLATKTAAGHNRMKLCFDDDGGVGDDNSRKKATTIITCKYWTATDSFCLTSALAFNNNNQNIANNNGNVFTCYQHQQLLEQQAKYHADQMISTITGNDPLTMYPTSFFNQVAAMATRPLTR